MSNGQVIAQEFDCCECGKHIVVVAGPVSEFHLCAICTMLPGWPNDPKLVAQLDPEMPLGGWPPAS